MIHWIMKQIYKKRSGDSLLKSAYISSLIIETTCFDMFSLDSVDIYSYMLWAKLKLCDKIPPWRDYVTKSCPGEHILERIFFFPTPEVFKKSVLVHLSPLISETENFGLSFHRLSKRRVQNCRLINNLPPSARVSLSRDQFILELDISVTNKAAASVIYGACKFYQ